MAMTRWIVINCFLLTACVNYSRAASCRDGWLQHGEHCYFVANQGANWYEAASNCTRMNSTLTSITDEDEHQFIANISDPSMDYWIGLKINTPGVDFKCCQWIDGSQSSWSDWAWDEPDGGDTCASVAYYDKWRDTSCNKRMKRYVNNPNKYTISYICKTDDSNDNIISTSHTTTILNVEGDQLTLESESPSSFLVVDISNDNFISTSDTTTTLNVEGDQLTLESESPSSSLVIAVSVGVSLILLVGLAVLLLVLWLKRRKKRTPHRAEENVYTNPPSTSPVPQMEMSPSNNQPHPTPADVTVSNDGRHDNSGDQTDPSQSISNQDVTELYAVVRKNRRSSIDVQVVDNPNYAGFDD